MRLSILHTNDLHGSLTAELGEVLRSRRDPNALLLDSGDAVKAGNLAIPLKEDPVWKAMSAARYDAGTLGNRESHVLDGAFQAKVRGCLHPLLCSNLYRKDGSRPLADRLVLDCDGTRVGLFGVMVPMVTERMLSAPASVFLWKPPIAEAKRVAQDLRPEVDVLIALTHIGYREDQALADACPMIDIILGGHSHTVLHEPVQIGRTWIAQGGSHARWFGLYVWSGDSLAGGLEALRER